VNQNVISIGLIFAALIGAITWNLITFFLGLPTSSSHALIGGMIGAAVAKAGFSVLVWEGIRTIAVFIVLAPLAPVWRHRSC
jgi:PiT family inorganic phosphate transporter